MTRYDQSPKWIFRNGREVEHTPLPILIRGFYLTLHAKEQMCRRRISAAEVCAALDYGRTLHQRDGVIYVIDRHAAESCRNAELGDNRELEGLQIVCSDNNRIITAYKNRDLRSLKPKKRHY